MMLSAGDKGFTGGFVSTTFLSKAFGIALFEWLHEEAHRQRTNIMAMNQTLVILFFLQFMLSFRMVYIFTLVKIDA